MTPEEAEERECIAEDRAKGKREDALIESGIVERFLRGGFGCATFPGGQLLYKDEHKVVCAHINYLASLLDDPTLGRLVPVDVQAALDAALPDSEDVNANT